MLRLTPPRVVYSLGLLTLVYLSLKIFSDSETPKRCDLSHEYQETLEQTIGKVHLVLKKIGLTHVLCYDTLGRTLQSAGGIIMIINMFLFSWTN